jgi:hypothetical protein
VSDAPFGLPPVPLMSPDQALTLARGYKALAENLRQAGVSGAEANMADRQSQWWLNYSIALAQSRPEQP